MGRILATLRARLAGRAGMTVLEVLLSMAIFMVGSVSILGLFVAASVLHTQAINRRTASFIADGLLAEVKSTRFRDVFARTSLAASVPAAATDIPVDAISADRAPTEDLTTLDYETAHFDLYPRPYFSTRTSGPTLIGNEWVWYNDLLADFTAGADLFQGCERGQWGTTPAPHAANQYVLQPRTWHFVLDDAIAVPEPLPPSLTVLVRGDPTSQPPDRFDPAFDGVPSQGYIVVDEEWMRYGAIDFVGGQGQFDISDANKDGDADRGWGDTQVVAHAEGTPVTVATEHPYYPGFYYTVQFYPTNASGQQSHVVISVGYRAGDLFRARSFRSVFAPSAF